jgi:hypothetical protein
LGSRPRPWRLENCSLPRLSLVGTCHEGQCRQRCLEDLDCQPPKRLGVPDPPCLEMSLGGGGGGGGDASAGASASAPGLTDVGAGGAGGAPPILRPGQVSLPTEYVCARPYGPVGLCFRRCEQP